MPRIPVSCISPRRLAKEIARHLAPKRKYPSPTLDEFVPRFMEEFCKANRQKPRGIEAKESIFRVHLCPRFGRRRLDRLRDVDVQRLKSSLSEKKPKTVNNILTTLNKLLKTAVRWGAIEKMPFVVDFLHTELRDVGFYEFEQYEHLMEVARGIGPQVLAVVLLGGDAGLRRNEMIALSPLDVSMERGLITVRHSDWNGQLLSTKSQRGRVVPMTLALRAVLLQVLPGKTKRVLTRDNGDALSVQTIRTWIAWAQRAAGLRESGALHVLRHTFCSHLAMRGASVLAIRELAGHRSLRTTLRYMHLSPGERSRAIGLLDDGRSGKRGNHQGRH